MAWHPACSWPDSLGPNTPLHAAASPISHQQKKTCLHMYLLCLTGTCNDWQGFCKEIFCNVCKPGQGLTVDLQPTYFMTYVPCRKCNLQPTLLHLQKTCQTPYSSS